jgi:hypothetical protein
LFQVLPKQLKGNPVEVRNGPAAVAGDERHTTTDGKKIGKEWLVN